MEADKSIKSFCERNEIPHCIIWYYLSDINGKKQPVGEQNNKTKEEIITRPWIKKLYDENIIPWRRFTAKTDEDGKTIFKTIQLTKTEKKSVKYAYSLYLKHTENIYCLDIDDESIRSIDDLIAVNEDFRIFENSPYLQGNKKGIHIYMKVNNVPIYTNEKGIINHIQGDFIHPRNNMWERTDKEMMGKSLILGEFEFNDIKHIFNETFGIDAPKKKTEKKMTEKNTEDEEEVEVDFIEYDPVDVNEMDIELLDLLPAKYYNEYEHWRTVGWILKNCNVPFEVFDEFSKKSLNYKSSEDVRLTWDLQKKSNVNIGLLHSWARQTNYKEYIKRFRFDDGVPQQYLFSDDVIEKKIIKEEENPDKTDFIISKRYLLDESCGKCESCIKKEKCVNFEYYQTIHPDDVFQNQLIRFSTDESIKTLTLKSGYDTGKSQMLKKYIRTFNPKRILWISYRKSLTCDIMQSFKTEFDFKDYQTGKYDADRLIIQTESILKLEKVSSLFTDDEDGSIPYQTYDLIIIDEIESVLKQFTSNTFKGKSKECFQYMEKIIMNSGKLILLDGDIGHRTYDFSGYFGKAINIVNKITFNPREFIITPDRELYYNDIKSKIEQNKKIVIVSMSATELIGKDIKEETKEETEEEKEQKECYMYIIDKIKQDFPTKNIQIYTGKSDDRIKKNLDDVLNTWDKCDILCYSPTIESGVNFDKEYFDTIYGIFSRSTTSRQFFQMLYRVRKIKNNQIMILNESFDVGFDLNKMKIEDDIFFSHTEVKNSLLLTGGIHLESKDFWKDGKLYRYNDYLSAYDNIYIHNRAEELNNGHYTFLKMFHILALQKGHSITYLKNTTKKDAPKKDAVSLNKTLVCDAPDINDSKYDELIEKQKRDGATEEDKRSIEKHFWKRVLGVDKLTPQFIDPFHRESMQNFTALIDEQNIPEYGDNETIEKKDRVRLLKGIIRDLGFNNIFDSKIIYKDDLEKAMEKMITENTVFTDFKNTKIRFSLDEKKKKYEFKTTKSFLGFINTLFNNYHIAISYKQVRKDGEKVASYYLETLNGINELLEYRIERGFCLSDRDNIRTPPSQFIYSSLINSKTIEESFKKQERINQSQKKNEKKTEKTEYDLMEEWFYKKKNTITKIFGKCKEGMCNRCKVKESTIENLGYYCDNCDVIAEQEIMQYYQQNKE